MTVFIFKCKIYLCGVNNLKDEFDFYSKTSLKSYNLNETMRYQLSRLDTLDVFTRRHSEGVANLTCRLCEHLKLNPTFTVYCTTCAYLHDIGKMFIPASILQKKARLTPEEYEIMKTHVIRGYNICMEDYQLRPYANGPLYHHEGLDGSGYPKHLTIDDIPLEGQIIRVADEYDAIVNKRQYKSHINISDTLKIIIENSNPRPIKKNMEHNYDKAYVKLRKKYGRVNKKIVVELLKIVIEDIEVEIASENDYVSYLNSQLKRLHTIDDYHKQMESSLQEDRKAYFLSGINELLEKGETPENYIHILHDYENAYLIRKEKIDDLYKEIDIIKHLKV